MLYSAIIVQKIYSSFTQIRFIGPSIDSVIRDLEMLKITELKTNLLKNKSIQVTFVQRYTSEITSDIGVKKLIWVKEGKSWKIVKETGDLNTWVSLYDWGEPTLHQDLPLLIEYLNYLIKLNNG